MTVTALTAYLPSIISKSIFAPRRADKSIESNNAPATILNAGIAVMQLSKLGDGVAAIAKEGKATTKALQTTVSKLAENESIFNEISKATNQITKHVSINSFIGLAALANVLMADKDDRERALLENAGMYGGMLVAEGAHKLICGKYEMNGDEIKKIDGLYKNYEFLSKPVDNMNSACLRKAEAIEAVKDCGEVKRFVAKVVKNAPAIVKGLSFAGCSILGSAGGYKLCSSIADNVIGKEAS